MTHPNPPEMVTQADREAAAEYLAMIAPTMPNLAENVRTKQSALARAFARHRPTPDREAIARAATLVLLDHRIFVTKAVAEEAGESIADVIIALIEGGGAHG